LKLRSFGIENTHSASRTKCSCSEYIDRSSQGIRDRSVHVDCCYFGLNDPERAGVSAQVRDQLVSDGSLIEIQALLIPHRLRGSCDSSASDTSNRVHITATGSGDDRSTEWQNCECPQQTSIRPPTFWVILSRNANRRKTWESRKESRSRNAHYQIETAMTALQSSLAISIEVLLGHEVSD